jgi:hypothetical protein
MSTNLETLSEEFRLFPDYFHVKDIIPISGDGTILPLLSGGGRVVKNPKKGNDTGGAFGALNFMCF